MLRRFFLLSLRPSAILRNLRVEPFASRSEPGTLSLPTTLKPVHIKALQRNPVRN